MKYIFVFFSLISLLHSCKENDSIEPVPPIVDSQDRENPEIVKVISLRIDSDNDGKTDDLKINVEVTDNALIKNITSEITNSVGNIVAQGEHNENGDLSIQNFYDNPVGQYDVKVIVEDGAGNTGEKIIAVNILAIQPIYSSNTTLEFVSDSLIDGSLPGKKVGTIVTTVTKDGVSFLGGTLEYSISNPILLVDSIGNVFLNDTLDVENASGVDVNTSISANATTNIKEGDIVLTMSSDSDTELITDIPDWGPYSGQLVELSDGTIALEYTNTINNYSGLVSNNTFSIDPSILAALAEASGPDFDTVRFNVSGFSIPFLTYKGQRFVRESMSWFIDAMVEARLSGQSINMDDLLTNGDLSTYAASALQKFTIMNYMGTDPGGEITITRQEAAKGGAAARVHQNISKGQY